MIEKKVTSNSINSSKSGSFLDHNPIFSKLTNLYNKKNIASPILAKTNSLRPLKKVQRKQSENNQDNIGSGLEAKSKYSKNF